MTKKHIRHTMNHGDLVGLFRSSHRRCSVKKGIPKNFANFTGKHLCWSLLQACNFNKKRLQHWCFPVKLSKFLRTSILKNICERLILFNSPQKTIANSSGEFGLVSFIKQNNLIQSNAAIPFIYKFKKNFSLTFTEIPPSVKSP